MTYYPFNNSTHLTNLFIKDYFSINKNIDKKIDNFTNNEYDTISQITDNIYLSNIIGAHYIIHDNSNILNISCVINCTKTIPNYFEKNNITYMRVPVDDTTMQNIEQYFDSTYNFIEKCISENKKILIHCYAGVSRSATILIAYLIRKNKWSLDNTIAFVKSKRSIIHPNQDFYKALVILSNKYYISKV